MNGKILWLLKDCLAALYFSFQLSTVNPKLVRNEVSLSTEVVTPHIPELTCLML